MVMNAKGGCGKSTLATNIASYFANEGASVALADYDPQRSSLDWLDRRPEDRPKIAAVAAFEDGLRRCPRGADFCIIDAPARHLHFLFERCQEPGCLGKIGNGVKITITAFAQTEGYMDIQPCWFYGLNIHFYFRQPPIRCRCR